MHPPAEWVDLLRHQAAPRSGLHVTDCLGCPRKKALLAEGAPVDLLKLDARLRGSLIHAALATVDPETAEIPVAGMLFGEDIVGSVDRLRDGIVTDYKNPNGKSRPTGAYPEQAWQLETYRVLLAQDDRPTSGWALHNCWKSEWQEPITHSGPLRTEAELAAFRPHGGAYTAGEIARLTGRLSREGDLRAGSLPLVGSTMKIGTGTSCDYCEVSEACKAAGVEVEF